MSLRRRHRAGDPLSGLSASDWNALIDMLDEWQLSRRGAGQPSKNPRRGEVYYARNGTGSAVDRYQVMGIDGLVFEPSAGPGGAVDAFKRRLVMKGVAPEAGTHTHKFMVALEPIADGKVGRVSVSGLVQCRVEMKEGATTAGVADGGVEKLTAGQPGARIVYAAGTSGDQWAVVDLAGDEPACLAKVTAVDAVNGVVDAVEVDRVGEVIANGRVWDGGAAPNLPRLGLTNKLDLPLVDDVVEVYSGLDSNGDLVWSVLNRSQDVLAVVTSQDVGARTFAATEANPDGGLRPGGRVFADVRIHGRNLPRVGQVVSLGYGYNGVDGVDWFWAGDNDSLVMGRVTSSAAGSVDWVEVDGATFADVVGGLSATAALPNGWQAMPVDTIVALMPIESGYVVVSTVRGVDGEANGHDQRVEGRNTLLTDWDWDIDDQGTTAGVQSIELGQIYAFDTRGFAVDLYNTVHTSEGVLQKREYSESYRLTGDVDPANATTGHIGMEKLSDDFNHETWRLFLGPPLSEVTTTKTIDLVAGANMTGGGQVELTFDNTGRFNGVQGTDTITFNATDQTGGGGGHTSITGQAPITASGSPGSNYTIGLAAPGPASTNVDLSAQGDPSYLVSLTGHGTMQFDSSGRYVGGGSTDQLFVEQIDIDVVTGVSFSVANGLEVTKKSITVVARDNGDNTSQVSEATECS